MTNAKSTDHIELNLPCLSDYVAVARLTVSGVASRMNFNVEDIEDIKIAVSEACTNAVQYAYTDKDKDPRVILKCIIHPDKLEIQIKDNGKGFHLDKIEKNKLTADLSTEKEIPNLGLGITFMKSLMSSAEFITSPGEGTLVKLFKNI